MVGKKEDSMEVIREEDFINYGKNQDYSKRLVQVSFPGTESSPIFIILDENEIGNKQIIIEYIRKHCLRKEPNLRIDYYINNKQKV